MAKIENFDTLVNLATTERSYSHMRPVIAKELLHYDILFALDSNGLLEQLTFQGGTCLRLCYGGNRFSEDLDFVGGYDFSSSDILDIKTCLEDYIGARYGFEVEAKEPKDLKKTPTYKDIKVDKWQIRITTSPGRKNLPKQRIKFEVANIPAYSREPNAILQNYDFLPDGYSDVVIMSESLDEIMADKLVSLVSCQKYIRYRDIWDLRWLKQKSAQVNTQYILAKLSDYKEKDYQKKLQQMQSTIEALIRSKQFSDEMSRFLPMDVQERTLNKANFIDLLIKENLMLLATVKGLFD